MANPELEQTVLWDLKETVRVCGEVLSWVGDPDINSWRFPDVPAVCVDCLSEYEEICQMPESSSSTERYQLLLELVYDRIIMFLELTCRFLENLPSEIQTKECESIMRRRNVRARSRFMKIEGNYGLAEPLSELWSRLLGLRGFILQQLGQFVRNNDEAPCSSKMQIRKMHRTSETQYCLSEIDQGDTLSSCESCYLTRSIIREISKFLCGIPDYNPGINSGPNPGQHSVLARDEVRSELFTLSDWGAAKKLLKAAADEIKNTVNRYKIVTDSHSDLLGQLNNLQKLHAKNVQKLEDNFQDFSSQLKKQLENVESNKKDIERKYEAALNEIERKKREQSELESQVKKSEENYLNYLKTFKQFEKEAKEREEELISSLQANQNELQMERERANRAESRQRNSERINLNITEELKSSLTEAQMKAELWTKLQQKNEQRINSGVQTESEGKSAKEYQMELSKLRGNHCSLLGELNENRNTIKRLEKQLRESKDRENVLLEYPDVNGPIGYKVKGDPICDMEGQIKANELRIKLLIDQNKRMERTVAKLRSLSSKQKMSSE